MDEKEKLEGTPEEEQVEKSIESKEFSETNTEEVQDESEELVAPEPEEESPDPADIPKEDDFEESSEETAAEVPEPEEETVSEEVEQESEELIAPEPEEELPNPEDIPTEEDFESSEEPETPEVPETDEKSKPAEETPEPVEELPEIPEPVEEVPEPTEEHKQEESAEEAPEPVKTPDVQQDLKLEEPYFDESDPEEPTAPTLSRTDTPSIATPIPAMRGAEEEVAEEFVEEEKVEEKKEEVEANIFALRTTANREDQVMTFVVSNAARKKIPVYSVIRPHGMRGYIFLEAAERSSAEEAAHGIPYARGLLPKQVQYNEIEHMLEQVKKDVNMQKNDIVEIISGAFKREKAKVTRIDKTKEEVVVELLEAAVPIPITLKIDAVKVIRRPGEDEGSEL